MGYSLKAVRVPISLVADLVGCKDQTVLDDYRKKLKTTLEEVDDRLQNHSPNDLGPIGQAPDSKLIKLQEEMERLKAGLKQGGNIASNFDAFAHLESFMSESTTPKASRRSSGKLPSAEEVLRHIIFGSEMDRRAAFAYDLVLQGMAEQNGTVLEGDNWIDIRSSANLFTELDKLLLSRGIGSDALSVQKHLIDRGNPLLKTHSGDFPFVGYLTLKEIEGILPALESQNFRDRGPEEYETYLFDLTLWMETTQENQEDLLCFYV